jgi:hypothetical protein
MTWPNDEGAIHIGPCRLLTHSKGGRNPGRTMLTKATRATTIPMGFEMIEGIGDYPTQEATIMTKTKDAAP